MIPLVTGWKKEDVQTDPESFFTSLDVQLGLSARSGFYDGLKGVDNDWASEIRARLEDLGYEVEGLASTEMDPFGLEEPLAHFQTEIGMEPSGRLDENTERALAGFVEWEGDLEGLELPGRLEDERSRVYVRSLQYRLKKLSFYDGPVTGAYDARTREASAEFQAGFGLLSGEVEPEETEQQMFRLICDPYAMNAAIKRLLNNQPLLIKSARADGPACRARDLDNLFLHKGRFRFSKPSAPCVKLEGLCVAMKPLDELGHRHRDKAAKSLLQLWMWMLSGYQARLDGVFGSKSLDALCDFLDENQYPEREYIVGCSPTDVLVAPAIFTEFGLERPGAEEVQRYEDYVLLEMERTLLHEERHEEAGGRFSRIFKKITGTAKRLYQGTKSILARIGRTFAGAAKWVWRRLGELGKAGLHLMSQVLSLVRKALARFWRSLRDLYKFLDTGAVATFSETSAYISLFQNDFDAVGFYPVAAATDSADLLRRHVRNLREKIYLFSMACKIVGIAIGAAVNLTKGPIGWSRLAVMLAKDIREIVRMERERSVLALEGVWA